jgi:hypothetical protein
MSCCARNATAESVEAPTQARRGFPFQTRDSSPDTTHPHPDRFNPYGTTGVWSVKTQS